ncbi:MAG: hypothetical protein DRI94_04040 [Bacteroidetes bacterium]|nr:MAG: hypothetical protein DRI94_04040 [Bacteroidota bacterium]
MNKLSHKYHEINSLKNKFIDSALIVGTVLGFASLIPGLINAYSKSVIEFHTISDFITLLLFLSIYFFRKKIKLEVKTLFILLGLLLFIFTDFVLLGIFSDNKIFIILFLFLGFLIFSLRTTLWFSLIIFIGYIVIAYLTITGFLKPSVDANIRAVSIEVWIINLFLITIVSFAVILVIKRFNDYFLKLIHDLEETNKHIIEKESNYTEIFNSVSDAIFIHDMKGNITDANDSMIKMFKYRKDELLTMDSKLLNPGFAPYDFEHYNDFVKETLKNGKSVFEWYPKDKEGNLIWVEITLKSTEIGGENRILSVVKNIDKQKKASLELEEYKNELEYKVKVRTEELETLNEELKANNEELNILNENLDYQKGIIEQKEKRLNSIINNQGEGFGINDSNEYFISANYRAHEIFNVPAGKLVGMNLKDFFDDKEWVKITEQSKLRKKNIRSSYEVKITLKDGSQKILIVTGTPYYDDEGNITGTIANFRDITERVHKENKLRELNEEFETLNEELNEANEELSAQKNTLQDTLNQLNETQNQLIQSEKMASLGVLAAGVAHEINNPLNYIMGGVTGLETMCKEQIHENKERVKPIMDAIKEGVRRTGEIVNSLSHLSRTGNSIKEDCDINLILDNCLIILKNKLKNKIEIRKYYNNSSDIIKCNKGKLHQVFLNILSNAEQSVKEKGIITISTEINNKFAVISIEDNGEGISKENLSKITDPFFTTKEPGKGTGLGLSIVHQIIEEQKGTIEFKSKIGKGTKVIIKLPNN